MHTRCIYRNIGREINIYTVIYCVYVRFWPTLVIAQGGHYCESGWSLLLDKTWQTAALAVFSVVVVQLMLRNRGARQNKGNTAIAGCRLPKRADEVRVFVCVCVCVCVCV